MFVRRSNGRAAAAHRLACTSPAEQGILQADYLPFCEPVTMSVPATRVPRCRDPVDRPFLSDRATLSLTALLCSTNIIVTVAKHFAARIRDSEQPYEDRNP